MLGMYLLSHFLVKAFLHAHTLNRYLFLLYTAEPFYISEVRDFKIKTNFHLTNCLQDPMDTFHQVFSGVLRKTFEWQYIFLFFLC